MPIAQLQLQLLLFSPPKGPSPRVGIPLSQDSAASAFPATPSIRRALPEMSSKSGSSGLEGEERHLSVVGGEHLGSDGDAGVRDAVFGNLTEKGPNYRNASSPGLLSWWEKLTNGQVGWVGTVALMMKTQIGLGVLSIPATFDTLGLIPGLICLLAIAGITTWSDHIVGVFKRRHPEVYGIDDAGGLMFGRIGREAFGAAFCVCK